MPLLLPVSPLLVLVVVRGTQRLQVRDVEPSVGRGLDCLDVIDGGGRRHETETCAHAAERLALQDDAT